MADPGRSATYRVWVDNSAGTGRGVVSVTLDGQPAAGGAVPLRDDGGAPAGRLAWTVGGRDGGAGPRTDRWESVRSPGRE